jgi:hypothetical protein
MVEPLIHPAHKTEVVNRLENIRFCLFVFNGKEKDYESGFHYYGARYYWSEVLTGRLRSICRRDAGAPLKENCFYRRRFQNFLYLCNR